MRPFTVTLVGVTVGSGDFLYFGRGAVSFTAGEGKGECAHGEYSEYPASTSRPDYQARLGRRTGVSASCAHQAVTVQ